MDEARRRRRREIRQLNNESVWLQKALFALRKAEEAREKLADVRSEEAGAYTLPVGDDSLPVEVLEDALEERTKELIGQVRTMRRELR